MKRHKYYLGRVKSTANYELFKTTREPSPKWCTIYSATIGAFRTKRGAMFMLKYGRNNPHIQTVGQAEKLVRLSGTELTAEFKRQRKVNARK